MLKNQKYLFIENDKNDFKTLQNIETVKILTEKWGLHDLKARTWSFEGKFDESTDISEFLDNFTRTHGVYSTGVNVAKYEPLTTNVTGKSFFQKLMKPPLAPVRNVSGHPIFRCSDRHVGNLWLCNTLQTAICDQESDEYEIFDDNDRKELIFRILKGCVIGGEYCQYEDSFDSYEPVIIGLYRDMIGKSVVKNPSGSVIVVAKAFSISELDNLKVSLDDRSFALLTIDPIERKVRILSFNSAI